MYRSSAPWRLACGTALAAAMLSALAAGAAPGAESAHRPPASQLSALLALQDEGDDSRGSDDPWEGEGRSRSLTTPSKEELAEPSSPPSAPSRISVGVFPVSAAIPLLGYAGAGSDAPTWSQAFGLGIGAGLSGGYRILACLDARVDGGYTRFEARTFQDESPVGVRDNELTAYSVYWFAIGPRFYALLDRPTARWFDQDPKKPYLGLCPFAGFRVGLLFTGAVDWPEPAPASSYWDSGVTFMFEVYLGVEHRLTEFLGAYLEAGMPVFGPPRAASLGPGQSGMNEAGSMTALRLSLGLLVAF